MSNKYAISEDVRHQAWLDMLALNSTLIHETIRRWIAYKEMYPASAHRSAILRAKAAYSVASQYFDHVDHDTFGQDDVLDAACLAHWQNFSDGGLGVRALADFLATNAEDYDNDGGGFHTATEWTATSAWQSDYLGG